MRASYREFLVVAQAAALESQAGGDLGGGVRGAWRSGGARRRRTTCFLTQAV
jgi:hypothetical protein